MGVLLLVTWTGCSSLGPVVLPRDRFDYSSALSESWKYQTLLNIVKLRYLDTPIFVDVAQVVSGYQLTTQVNAAGTLASINSVLRGNTATFGASGQYVDRPTITYAPLTGDQYIRGIMAPIPPESIFFTILSGWPADAILFTSVATMNGLNNQRFGGMNQQPADPAFFRVMEITRKLQGSGALGFRIKQGKDKDMTNLFFFRKENLTEDERHLIQEAKQLLRLNPEEHDFRLVFGPTAASDKEIAIQTRSLIQIMMEVAAQADVPDADIREGRATTGFVDTIGERQNVRSIHIYGSPKKSDTAFISIRYRDRWFWIDDRDLKSKRSFAFLMYLFSLAETGEKKPLPLITIPAQ